MAAWITVVDDDAANLQVAGRILSRNNMRVTALRSGKALLEYLKEHGFSDLILLDIKMPEMDGFETLKRLREYEASIGRDEIPVIFLTGVTEKDVVIKTIVELKPDGYVVKPSKKSELVAKIIDVLG